MCHIGTIPQNLAQGATSEEMNVSQNGNLPHIRSTCLTSKFMWIHHLVYPRGARMSLATVSHLSSTLQTEVNCTTVSQLSSVQLTSLRVTVSLLVGPQSSPLHIGLPPVPVYTVVRLRLYGYRNRNRIASSKDLDGYGWSPAVYRNKITLSNFELL
jgi:hypothetical protein